MNSGKPIAACIALLTCLTLSANVCSAAGNTVTVHGDGIQTWQWTDAQIQAEMPGDVQTVQYSIHGAQHESQAVLLISILRHAGFQATVQMGPAADPKKKNAFLHFVVQVIGRDGYSAVFSLGELTPAIGNHPAWVALDADGRGWDDQHAPAELLIPSDAKPARWVRGIAEVHLIDLDAAPTTQP